MEFDDIEFKEGVHKSVRRGPLHRIEANDEQISVPVDEMHSENDTAPAFASIPVPQHERGRYGRWFQVVAVLLLICIVGGGVLVFQRLHATQKTQVARTMPDHNALCATIGAQMDMNRATPALHSVAALSNKDVWTVGNLLDQTLTEHWDGTSWHAVPSPNGQTGPGNQVGQTGSNLNSVVPVASNDVWAVGAVDLSQFNTGVGLQTLIEHWDGSRWSIVPSPDGTPFHVLSETDPNGLLLQGRNELRGIAAVSANDIWAVGSTNSSSFYAYNGYNNSQASPLVEHWDGNKWSITPVPNLPPNAVLNAITAIAPDNVWAVGTTLQKNDQGAFIAHWDGHQWNIAQKLAEAGYLGSISASGANDIWAAGFASVEHWDGTNWNRVDLPANKDGSYDLFPDVFARSANDVWLAGSQQAGNSTDSSNASALIEHWDGQQ